MRTPALEKLIYNETPLALLPPEDQAWIQSHPDYVNVLTKKGLWIPAKKPLQLNLTYRIKQKANKRTIAEWLECIPHEWKEDALSAKPILGFDHNTIVGSLADAVLFCCDWNSTKATDTAWNNLYMAISESKPLPKFKPLQSLK